jgi:hypothetical protein
MKTIKDAVNHFIFKLNPKNKIWNATERDKQAIDKIIEFVEQKHKQQRNTHQLFAKLYITFYGELLKYYECTVFDSTPQKAIHKILDTPIDVLIKKFIDKHNDVEMALQIPKKDRYKHPKQLKQYDIKQIDKMEYMETEDNLIAMINLAINQYS